MVICSVKFSKINTISVICSLGGFLKFLYYSLLADLEALCNNEYAGVNEYSVCWMFQVLLYSSAEYEVMFSKWKILRELSLDKHF